MSGLLEAGGAEAIGSLYRKGSVAFTRDRHPNPFAVDFFHELKPVIGSNGHTQGTIAELGSGAGRDAAYFAVHGLQVIAFELSQDARSLIEDRFRADDLEHRLTLRGNFQDTSGIEEQSLVGVYAVSSLHYYHPLKLYELLWHYKRLLSDNGKAGIALKTRNSSWYEDGIAARQRPDLLFDFNTAARQICAFTGHGLDDEERVVHGFRHEYPEGVVTRWYYSAEQIATLGRLAGLHPIKINVFPIHNYARQDRDEEFAYVVFAKHVPHGESR